MQDKKQFVLYGILLVLGLSILANLVTPLIQQAGDPNVAIFIYVLLSLCLFLVLYNYQPSPSRRQNELVLIKRVKGSWVDLERWTSGVLLKLEVHWEPQAVASPSQGSEPVISHEGAVSDSIVDIFKNSGRSLLVLGEAGSGKTGILLGLARELLGRAEQDESEPISVILNLSTWKSQAAFQTHVVKKTDKAPKQSGVFEAWLINELASKYDVAEEISREWLLEQRLILLLDGFDETTDQKECINAINDFLAETGAAGIAVCSRTTEYKMASKPGKLKVANAIRVQSLSPSQIDMYLRESGSTLVSPESVLRTKAALAELARSPLMLNLMVLIGKERNGFDNIEGREAGDYQDLVLENYIAQRQRRGEEFNLRSAQRMLKWLGWLAQGMHAHSQAVFLIEKLQPSWLPKPKRRWLYLYILASRWLGISCVMATGVFMMRLAQTVGHLVYNKESGIGQRPIEWMGVIADLPKWLVVTILFGGSLMAVMDLSRLVDVSSWQHFTKSRVAHLLLDGYLLLRKNNLAVNLGVCFLVFFLAARLLSLGWETSAKGALTYAVPLGLIIWFRGRGQHIANDIRTADKLVWSPRSIPGGLLSGWVIGLAIGLVVTVTALPDQFVVAVIICSVVALVLCVISSRLVVRRDTKGEPRTQTALLILGAASIVPMIVIHAGWGMTLGLKVLGLFGAMGALVGSIIKGLTKVSIVEKTSPNQGIKLSIRSAVLLLLLVGVCSVSLIWFYVLWFIGLEQLINLIGSPRTVLEAALFFGLGIGSLFGFAYGGFDVLNHLTLRAILFRLGLSPFNYEAILDSAVRLRFLRKVGGGYCYFHELIRHKLESQCGENDRSIGLSL